MHQLLLMRRTIGVAVWLYSHIRWLLVRWINLHAWWYYSFHLAVLGQCIVGAIISSALSVQLPQACGTVSIMGWQNPRACIDSKGTNRERRATSVAGACVFTVALQCLGQFAAQTCYYTLGCGTGWSDQLKPWASGLQCRSTPREHSFALLIFCNCRHCCIQH